MYLFVSAAACEDEQWVMIDDTLLEIHNDLTLTDQDNADECKRVCKEVCYTYTGMANWLGHEPLLLYLCVSV